MCVPPLKVRIVSPDKDFFQILSPSLRLLRIAPRGSGSVYIFVPFTVHKYVIKLSKTSVQLEDQVINFYNMDMLGWFHLVLKTSSRDLEL
jgi:hypothetical protein